jgi:uroporphyrinogen-III synthase
LAEIPPGAALVSIGPSTTAAARGFGLTVAAEARRPVLDELLEAIP